MKFKIKEKLNTKCVSLAQMAYDDVIIPDSEFQKGKSIVKSGFYDKHNNRYDLTVKLEVRPLEEIKDEEELEMDFATLESLTKAINDLKDTTQIKMNLINSKLESLETSLNEDSE